MFSGFQSNAFQSNAFQIARSAPSTGGGGGYDVVRTSGRSEYSEQKVRAAERKREGLERQQRLLEAKVLEASQRQQAALQAQQAAELEAAALQELNILMARLDAVLEAKRLLEVQIFEYQQALEDDLLMMLMLTSRVF